MPINIKLPTINDDKGNPLNVQNSDVRNQGMNRIKGQSDSRDEDGNKYPYGFTPEVDNIVNPTLVDPDTQIPIELGHYRKDLPNVIKTTPDINLKKMVSTNTAFGDNSSNSFLHGYDNYEDGMPRPIPVSAKNNKTVSLASFTNTGNDNEDPTIYGYDLQIDIDNSPLFNGAVEDFITKFSMIDEVSSRLEIYNRFKEKFFNYFNSLTGKANKSHYLKSITGLNKLTESNTADKTSAFSEYNKDIITMSIYEDVTSGIGEILNLYKLLSWSKVSGKALIPDNILRFEAELIITEVRKYNRIVKMTNRINATTESSNIAKTIPTTSADNPFFSASPIDNITNNDLLPETESKTQADAIYVIADLLTKYRYRIYECQFFFPTMPHGDTIDMWDIKIADSTEINFDYKFSTLKMEKFSWNAETPSSYITNNANINPTKLDAIDSNGGVDANGRIVKNQKKYDITTLDAFSINNDGLTTNQLLDIGTNQLDIMKESTAASVSNVDTMLLKIRNAAFNELNRQVINQARLLNKSIDNIRNKLGLGRISEPTNVYQEDYMKGNMFPSAAKNAVRDFVGSSIKDMFR